ncbi:MAG: Fic family protein [Candidatus Aenigmarchaeota archaeon]|nr:Fic family protein [Candidatus Aenigmarchaeota archaeon]
MRALQRKKGNESYYSLQHSFRKNGKVITKEKYLGKTPPKDIKTIKKTFLEECQKMRLHNVFEKIGEGFRCEWQIYPKSMKEKIKEQIAIAFTYNTNAIEGSKITLGETRELVEHKIAPNKTLDDVKETDAHAKVFLAMLNKKEAFNTRLILKWHNELFQDTKPDIAGKFREYRVSVGDYIAPDWQDVVSLIHVMIKFYNENPNRHPVELAARMHYRFEKIHPFGDGNGRVGRLIINYVLWHSGYPILIIEYKKRKSYYKALQKEEECFFNYFARRYLAAHKKYLAE